MISRPARQILVSLLLALYGPVSLCGIGLHALADANASHHDHAGGHCDEGAGASISAATDHCPLCEFQAQGQMQADSPPLISRPFVQPHLAVALSLTAARDRHPSASPRAPPVAPASLV